MPRADLHVHSCHSRVNGNLRFLKSRDCYSSPAAVYRRARERGMDFVTITDHDSIDGCLELLAARPGATDVIVGEEISCRVPDTSLQVHLGAYGMTEALHRDVQPLCRNVFEVAAYLRQQGVFCSLNHVFYFYREQVPLEAYLRLLVEVPGLEVRNGTMLAAHNTLAEAIGDAGAARARLAPVAGSDAHTLRRVGTTWTEAPGDSAAAFLDHVARGRDRAGGAHGTSFTVAGDAYGVIWAYCRSLLGFGPRDHGGLERALFVATAVASVPLQWLPLAIALAGKRREARTLERCAGRLAGWLDASAERQHAAVRPTPAVLPDQEAAG